MRERERLGQLLRLIYIAAGAFAVWLVIKYALIWIMPFIIAFLIARLIEPAVSFLTKKFRFKRGFAAAACTMLVFAVIISLLVTVIGRIVYELSALTKDLPGLLSELGKLFKALGAKLDGYISGAPEELRGYLQSLTDGFSQKGADMLGAVTSKIVSLLSAAASLSPKIVLFIFTSAVSAVFISSGYREAAGFLFRQIPQRHHATMRDIKSDFFSTIGKWVKAELMLSGITFVHVLAAFFVMRIEFAFLLALLVAAVDALPVFGAGSVLVPWALLSAITGDFRRALMLGITFAVIMIIRNIMEPKLIGGQIGLPPIATLFAMYIGFCTFGVLGMAFFPVGLMMLKQLNDKGYVRLWK